MKRIIMALVLGIVLTACSKTSTPTTETNQNNTPSVVEDEYMTYVTGLGFTNVTNVNGTVPYKTYTLNETVAADTEVYNQWMYVWENPSDYVGKEVSVYEYTAKKDNKDYNVYTLVNDNKVIGGYYYEPTGTIEEATVLHETYKPTLAEEFKASWDELFNLNK
ncbi:MAG TPA: hypothetical protein DCY20_06915 [Firmicutes bacterium]|nr:hypothetical protein [Bacillota bacterium]